MVWTQNKPFLLFALCISTSTYEVYSHQGFPFFLWRKFDIVTYRPKHGLRTNSSSHEIIGLASKKYIGFHILHKIRTKCCLKTYTAYSDIERLMLPSYVIQKNNMLCKNYTTYDKILQNTGQNVKQHIEK